MDSRTRAGLIERAAIAALPGCIKAISDREFQDGSVGNYATTTNGCREAALMAINVGVALSEYLPERLDVLPDPKGAGED